jgi:TetR/AcrR family transcriptional repressor of nem operon
MFERGYSNTGIQEVLTAVAVPKGSFYHYFESKEDFALAIIDHFGSEHTRWLVAILNDSERTPLERLRRYCSDRKEQLGSWHCRKGCLIGNLSQEMADQSETLRLALAKIMGNWRALFADCIAEGQRAGQIRPVPDARRLSEHFLDSWDGAVLRAKTSKCLEPVDSFIETMFNHILVP